MAVLGERMPAAYHDRMVSLIAPIVSGSQHRCGELERWIVEAASQ